MHPRHLVDLADLDPALLRRLIDHAKEFKADFVQGLPAGRAGPFLRGKYVTMVFEWPATRTKLHAEIATCDLGGTPLCFYGRDMPTSRGETIGDTTRVLSRHSDIILYRTGDHRRLLEMAEHSECPVINGCTDYSHPFRPLVEIMTYEEHRGSLAGRKVAFVGDCRMNQARSWVHAAVKFGASIVMICPDELAPDPAVLDWARAAGGDVTVSNRPEAAIEGADYVCTDIWVPMGHEDRARRLKLLEGFCIDSRMMALAAPNAVFMHPLAASRGDEVTSEVLDGPQSLVWQGGIENKRHLLKSIFAWQLGLA